MTTVQSIALTAVVVWFACLVAVVALLALRGGGSVSEQRTPVGPEDTLLWSQLHGVPLP